MLPELAPVLLSVSGMVSVQRIGSLDDALEGEALGPRRPATTSALDARLSVWGQAARLASERRAEALLDGAQLYVERVGRHAEVLRARTRAASVPLVDSSLDSLINLGVELLPGVVARSCRLLWVDPERVRENLSRDLTAELEAARGEVRRIQALYRRRARLWQNDQHRLDGLRDEIEGLKVPRCREGSAELVAKGLLLRHRDDAGFGATAAASGPAAHRVGPTQLARWIHQLDERLGTEPLALSLAH